MGRIPVKSGSNFSRKVKKIPLIEIKLLGTPALEYVYPVLITFLIVPAFNKAYNFPTSFKKFTEVFSALRK